MFDPGATESFVTYTPGAVHTDEILPKRFVSRSGPTSQSHHCERRVNEIDRRTDERGVREGRRCRGADVVDEGRDGHDELRRSANLERREPECDEEEGRERRGTEREEQREGEQEEEEIAGGKRRPEQGEMRGGLDQGVPRELLWLERDRGRAEPLHGEMREGCLDDERGREEREQVGTTAETEEGPPYG